MTFMRFSTHQSSESEGGAQRSYFKYSQRSDLQGLALARQKSNIHRAQSVDLSVRSPLGPSQAEAAFNLEESFRRAEAARAMSMDASRVPGIDSWPVDAILSGSNTSHLFLSFLP